MAINDFRSHSTSPFVGAYLGLGISTLSWSLMPVFQKELLDLFNPIEVTFLRFAGSAFLLLAILLTFRPRELLRVARTNPANILLTSVIGPLSATLALNFGIQNVAVSVAAVILAVEPILTYLIAASLGQEAWSTPRGLRIFVCFAGVAMMVTADAHSNGMHWTGLAAVSMIPVIWALNTIISKKLVANGSPLAVVAMNFSVSSAALVPFVGSAWLGKFASMGMYHWIALAYCVFLGTTISYCIWYACLQYVAPSTLSLSLYAIPLFTMAGAVLILGERLSLLQLVGIAVVLLGLYFVNSHRANG